MMPRLSPSWTVYVFGTSGLLALFDCAALPDLPEPVPELELPLSWKLDDDQQQGDDAARQREHGYEASGDAPVTRWDQRGGQGKGPVWDR